LPALAINFAKHLYNQVGFCGAAMSTAYSVYAQLVEHLDCTDDLYVARPEDVEWFKNYV